MFVFLWGTPQVKAFLDGIWIAKLPVAGLHNLVQKVPPVVAEPHAEAAVYNLNLLSATGTGILLAAIIAGFMLGYAPGGVVRMYGRTLYLDPLLAAHHRLHAGARVTSPATRAPTRRWAWRSRRPAGSIRCSARCSAGSAWR